MNLKKLNIDSINIFVDIARIVFFLILQNLQRHIPDKAFEMKVRE